MRATTATDVRLHDDEQLSPSSHVARQHHQERVVLVDREALARAIVSQRAHEARTVAHLGTDPSQRFVAGDERGHDQSTRR